MFILESLIVILNLEILFNSLVDTNYLTGKIKIFEQSSFM